jgi:hypothetical protein
MRDEEATRRPQLGDLFHHGVITKLFPSNSTGIVRTESGREVFFSYEFVILTGEAKSPLHLKVGQPVGYDVGWTPSGLRVTKIKTYPTTGVVHATDTSKRQGS